MRKNEIPSARPIDTGGDIYREAKGQRQWEKQCECARRRDTEAEREYVCERERVTLSVTTKRVTQGWISKDDKKKMDLQKHRKTIM